jgi:hypothetical protein
VPLVHHELCFRCGRTNLFGVLAEVEQTGPGAVAGRCFIKQDHQGSKRGVAHQGIVAAALSEAMAFACGPDARAEEFELHLVSDAPVGAWLELRAQTGGGGRAEASAGVDGVPIATAHGRYRG